MSPDRSPPLVPIPTDRSSYLVATAARAPSVQNTQPWRFRIGEYWIELLTDATRRLRMDPQGREMVISCGAALFGLRLGVRSLGFAPVVDLLPDRSRPQLLARVRLGAAEPLTSAERRLLEALPRRHTHRGPFTSGALPGDLLTLLKRDAAAEGATLALISRARGYGRLADLAASARSEQDADQGAAVDMQEWTRRPADGARDGVPATAFGTGDETNIPRGRLVQRDFDLGRDLGMLDSTGLAPAATAVLLTPGDNSGDWLCAGQALHRVLARAASRWVFASLHTQPLQVAAIRSQIADQLGLAGAPQLILQFGPARTTRVTARRPPGDLIDP